METFSINHLKEINVCKKEKDARFGGEKGLHLVETGIIL